MKTNNILKLAKDCKIQAKRSYKFALDNMSMQKTCRKRLSDEVIEDVLNLSKINFEISYRYKQLRRIQRRNSDK